METSQLQAIAKLHLLHARLNGNVSVMTKLMIRTIFLVDRLGLSVAQRRHISFSHVPDTQDMRSNVRQEIHENATQASVTVRALKEVDERLC